MTKPKETKRELRSLGRAYRNEEFINSSDARPIRILAEFLEPEARFARYKIEDTIVYFGSARLLSTDDAQKALEEAKAKNEGIKAAERLVGMGRYYDEAVDLSKRMTEWSKSLGKGKKRFITCSGGGPGIMEAVNRGASEANGLSIGFNISIPMEQGFNPYITPELNFEFHYFFIRKYWFAYMAKALVIFPGGFGTLDELAELLTLIQTKKIQKRMPIVIYGTEYWEKVINIKEMVNRGTLSESDLELFYFSDSPEDAFNYLTKELKSLYNV